MKKLIPVLFVFVLVLGLVFAQEAFADYKDGDPCPADGCDGTLVVECSTENPQVHRYYCTKCDFGASEDHWGGTASCTSAAVCEGCGAEYGAAGSHTPGKAVKEKIKEATCNDEGSHDEMVYCSACGKELSRKQVKDEALGHDYQPWPGHETITRMYFHCTRCDSFYWEHNSLTWNMKWNFVRYENGEHVHYKATSLGPDYAGVLTVIPLYEDERDKTGEIGLYLTPDDVYVWTWEHENRIELKRDGALLAFDVRDVNPQMFGLKEEQQPDYYVFTLTPSEEGWIVRIEAVMGEEKIPAQELKGVTLTLNGKETEITSNGVYKAE